MENDITYCFRKYLSDKYKNYGQIYHDLFESRKNDEIVLLEIGIGTLQNTNSNMKFWKEMYPDYAPGASLKAFRDYFPNGRIYGVDIQPDCLLEEKRIKTFLFDSTSKEMCDTFLTGPFDFIIDDGDHFWKSQIMTFENLFNKLSNTGIYILEDLAYPNEIKTYFESTNYNYEFRDGVVIIRK